MRMGEKKYINFVLRKIHLENLWNVISLYETQVEWIQYVSMNVIIRVQKKIEMMINSNGENVNNVRITIIKSISLSTRFPQLVAINRKNHHQYGMDTASGVPIYYIRLHKHRVSRTLFFKNARVFYAYL